MIKFKKKICIFLSTILLFGTISSKSFSEEDIFIIKDVEVEGPVTTNFLREKYINKAFKKSFEMLMSRIVLSEDLNNIKSLNLKEIKSLIKSFKIQEEKIEKDKY